MMPVLNNFYNKKFGTSFNVGDYKYHDLEKTWGGSKEDAVIIVEEFFQSPDFSEILPIANSPKSVLNLSKKHELFLVTSRPQNIKQRTLEFLQNYFPKEIKKVIHTGQYVSPASSINKFDVCVQEKADVLIEDCLEIAIDCANHGLKTFLLDSSLNQLNREHSEGKIPKNLLRVKSWPEIVERLK
jgi:uncharacterized HAD superfamily protein